MLLARPVAGAIGAQRPISAASTSERHAGLNLRVKPLDLLIGRRDRGRRTARQTGHRTDECGLA